MKNYIIILVLVLLFTSCKKLTNVLDNNPPNSLVPENVAQNRKGAIALLNGCYAVFHDPFYYSNYEIFPAVLGGTMRRNTSFPDIQFQDNTLTPGIANVSNYWTVFYKMMNQCNWVVQLVDGLPESEMTAKEKTEFKGQAIGLRAMATFDALRYFGQYYDKTSIYGVIVKTSPSNFTTRNVRRNTVEESYKQIFEDLDYAIANAPTFTQPTYFSVTAAKALKARVLLYHGDYAEAAALADDVIVNGRRTLSPTFASVFSTGFASTEMILMRATNAVTSAQNDRKKATYSTRLTTVTPWLKTFMTGDARAALTFNNTTNEVLKVNNLTFFSPSYFVRLAEMYLIKAEGLTRSDAPIADAKIPLQTIMSRAAGAPRLSTATTKPQLLDQIHAEYIKELCFESGADWFANIRFEKIQAIKPSVTKVSLQILPIPESEMVSNTLFALQNPDY